MKKITITAIFGLIGAFLWGMTAFLRGNIETSSTLIPFMLGIMPNIGATWYFISFGEMLTTKREKDFTFKTASITSALILIFAIISEIVHDLFINSPFDIYDIIATICSITLYLIIFYISKKGLRKQ